MAVLDASLLQILASANQNRCIRSRELGSPSDSSVEQYVSEIAGLHNRITFVSDFTIFSGAEGSSTLLEKKNP